MIPGMQPALEKFTRVRPAVPAWHNECCGLMPSLREARHRRKKLYLQRRLQQRLKDGQNMPYNVTVSTGDVADKAAVIQREAAELEARLTMLTSAMADLAGSWTGSASSAFQSVYETWKGAATQVKQTLDDLGASLRNASTQYDENEDALRSQWT